ncbi:MAG: site-specific DNA-methyltransferase [Zoogloeaceae bacterium]|jgi:site-specific DNA-methyltransferase (adenine-specific)|nr:site-specific DNA-methyltransferase [Zoogloeaceae bacterium]
MSEHIKLFHGEMLSILTGMESESVDAVITDPPYMLGVSSFSAKDKKANKCGSWADMENASYWYAIWMKEARRLLKPSGYFAVFGGWRSIPVYSRAFYLAELPMTNCLIWEKPGLGPSGPNQLRGAYEIVLLSAMETAKISNRSVRDVFSCPPVYPHEKHHPAEKPVTLMRHLVDLLTPPDGLVLDPFAGSGSTGVAALLSGRRFIGIEREDAYVEIAQKRLREANVSFPRQEAIL